MKNKNEETPLNEHIKKIMYRAGYTINETPKYRPIIEDDAEFDDLPPEVLQMTQDGQPSPNAGGGTDAYLEEAGKDNPDQLPGAQALGPTDPAEPSNAPAPDQGGDVPPVDAPADPMGGAPVDAGGMPPPEGGEEMPPPEGEMPPEGGEEMPPPVEEPVEPNPEKEVDQLQNEIIKSNLEAMKAIASKLESLEGINMSLTAELETLNSKVKEVEEPTNAQKLMAQKNVSYPYYFNLNDFWKNNWFDQQQVNNQSQEKGIRELPDGTFIADFDDLPTPSDLDIDDSFNSIV